jgi:aspartyl aminopeptidase
MLLESAQGAGAPIISQAIERISAALSSNSDMTSPDIVASVTRKSFILSVDMCHGIHPNYSSKHDKNHAPKMNSGLAVKMNNNQRYSTNGVTGFIMREIARKAGLPPLQDFIVRNDCPCGTTIGPILASKTGIRTADAGMPQLSMHSCREVMGVMDLTHGYNFFQGFYKHFRVIDDMLEG